MGERYWRPGVCGVPWPASLHDAAPLPCARPEGHPNDAHEAAGIRWPVVPIETPEDPTHGND